MLPTAVAEGVSPRGHCRRQAVGAHERVHQDVYNAEECITAEEGAASAGEVVCQKRTPGVDCGRQCCHMRPREREQPFVL